LLKEGLFPTSKFQSIHSEQLELYMLWRSEGEYSELVPFLEKYYPDEFTAVSLIYSY